LFWLSAVELKICRIRRGGAVTHQVVHPVQLPHRMVSDASWQARKFGQKHFRNVSSHAHPEKKTEPKREKKDKFKKEKLFVDDDTCRIL
jgi:hypothetical protein